MTSATKAPGLSLTGGLSLILKLLVLAPPKLLFNILRCYTLATLRGISLRNYAQCAFYRFALGNLTAEQIQFMAPSTVTIYNAWLTRRQSRAAAIASKNPSDKEAAFLASRLKLDTEPLPDGRSSLLWIGDRHRATKFVFFLHGGGYIAPALKGHMEWCARAYLLASSAAKSKSVDQEDEVAVAVLQYALAAPGAQYPTQLQQAADGLAHLFASGRVRPGNLVIGGDSAGGNLTAQMLSHLLRPHPAAREVVLEEPLAGTFLVSPWLSATLDWASVERNGGIDMLSPKPMTSVVKDVVGGVEVYEAEVREKNGWAMPMDLEDAEGWFRGLGKVVKEVYVTAGEQEILLDQGVAFADAVRRGNPGVPVKLEVMKDEAHDWIMIEGEEGVDGDATKRMRAWFTGVFWS
ncbi:Alpha/Beta hydrolase protein [Parachaetomium inaequale]|uniref:Alpha/Beta hydrolase protein n=1 Tax=Parachaetomium inaequale TaxID=2588326 RepID=A0AAN6PJ51_9PEZI|nr:Alpha/Beta hydrolase protein [Parachaetomium inaequale]